jgi:predicted transcriptional regulator of viral defense system
MRIESFEAAKEKIKAQFDKDDLIAYTSFDLKKIFNTYRVDWSIAGYRTADHFMKYLTEIFYLKLIKLQHQSTGSIKKIYTKQNATSHHIALTIKKDGYLSNYTAMQIHQLTLQIPKSIYLSYSKSKDADDIHLLILEQGNIDNAFSKSQRTTSDIYKSEIDNLRYFFIQKSYVENKIGIVTHNHVSYTDIERTLIDIAIRPAYSGGVFEVLHAFEMAKGIVNIRKLNNYLLELNYQYPYHQVIGFYLAKAGYENRELKIFKKYISSYKFYLTYNMSIKEYDEEWKIYYPKGF